MIKQSILILLLSSFLACKNKEDKSELTFVPAKWSQYENKKYPFRNRMLKDFMTNYKLNGVPKDSIITLLGEPNRSDNGHLFYLIKQDLFNDIFPIYTKTLVIKLTKDSTVEWRKIHE